MRKFLILCCFLSSIFLTGFSSPDCHEHECSQCVCECGLFIETDGDCIVLTGKVVSALGYGQRKVLEIPEEVTYEEKVYTVVGIGASAFRNNTIIQEVRLPSTMTYIGKYAFDGCENLQHIHMEEGVRYIGTAAFECCYSLQEVDLPSSVEYIGDYAFNHCYSVNNEEIVLPRNLKRLGENMGTPAHMFYDCGQDGLFTAFRIDERNKYYKTEDGILYTKDGSVLVSIPRGKKFQDNTYVMPQTVSVLGELSFSRNRNIKTIVLSDNLFVSGTMTSAELSLYRNRGNDLSVACYAYTGVEQYEARDSNLKYTSVDGVLYDKKMKTIIAIPSKYSGDLIIPDGVETWEKDALWTEIDYCRDLSLDQIEKISIPETLLYIDPEQMEAVNQMVDYYGTEIELRGENPSFCKDSGTYSQLMTTMVIQ